MENEYTFSFEFWDHKLYGILGMLNAIADGEMPPIEFELIKENLEATSFKDEVWTDHIISGNNYELNLLLAKNRHEDRNSIAILITAQFDLDEATEEGLLAREHRQLVLGEQIKAVSMFQGLFKDLELE